MKNKTGEIIISYDITQKQNRINLHSKLNSLVLRFISLITLTCLITLLVLSWISQWDSTIWTLTQYLGPLLFLGIWIPFSVSFLEIQTLKRTFPSILFGSVLVVLGALLLNQRLLFVIIDAISALFILEISTTSDFVVSELILGIFLPANEEIMKVIPIIVVAHAPIVIFNLDESVNSREFEKRCSIATLKQFGFYGIVSGTVFTFLELFLYQWQLISFPGASEEIFFQLLFRTLVPLHTLTTFLIALGVGFLKIRLAESQSVKQAIISSSGFFILGWGLHSLWNTINVFYQVYRPNTESELYMVLVVFGLFIFILLFFGIIKISTQQPIICNYCGLEERGKHNHENRSNKTVSFQKIPFLVRLFTHISINNLKRSISCPFCTNPLILGTCSTCGAGTFITCPRCNGFISETTSLCPHCNKKVKPLIELQLKNLSWPESFVLGVSLLASMAFSLTPISILIFTQMGDLGSIVIPIMLLYFIMGFTILTNVVIALFFNRTSGMLVLFCYFLELVFLIFIIVGGFVIIGFFKALFTQDILGLGIILLSSLLLFFMVYRFINAFFHNYSPVFPEYGTKTIKNLSNPSMEVNNDAS